MREAQALRRAAGALVEQQRHVHPVGHAVEQTDLQAGAPAGDAARDQGFQDAGVRGHAAGDVAGRDTDAARAGRMSGDHCEAGLCLHQQVVRLHRCVVAAVAVAGDVDGDQPRRARTQRVGPEPRTRSGARGEVLDEHVGAGQDAVQQRRIVLVLDVRDQALLAAVQPDEVAGQTLGRRVVAACEIAFRALDLDDAGAGVGQAGTAIGRGDRLFQ